MDARRKRQLAAMAVALMVAEEDEEPKPKRCWVKDWMAKKELGIQNQLYRELFTDDPLEFRRMLRVDCDQFLELLSRIGHRIQRRDTHLRRAIPARVKLELTLRYLASGMCANCRVFRNMSPISDCYSYFFKEDRAY